MANAVVCREPGKLETLGMTIEAADEAVLDRAELRGGVLVTDVENNSVAAEAGIALGDVITMFGRRAISSLSDMEDVLETVEPGDSVRLRVVVKETLVFLALSYRMVNNDWDYYLPPLPQARQHPAQAGRD